ncbi:MAG TPA: hypothetical protein VKA61_10225, partial [Sphingomicrobium sp.]|nr:hypothetical protein [Sphingomicrobium sp.]
RALACSCRVGTTGLEGWGVGGAVRRRAMVVLWALKRLPTWTYPHQPRHGSDVLAPYEPSVPSCGTCLGIKPALQHRNPLGELGEDRKRFLSEDRLISTDAFEEGRARDDGDADPRDLEALYNEFLRAVGTVGS